MLNSIEYVCPAIILIIIFFLKLTVDNRTTCEDLKRLTIETMVDVMSLAISFVVSYLIASAARLTIENPDPLAVSDFYNAILTLFVFVLLLIVTVLCSKITIRQYAKREKMWILILGAVIGYGISVSSLVHSIIILRSIGGC